MRVVEEAVRRWRANGQTLMVPLTREELLVIVSAIQTATLHPAMGTAHRDSLEAVGRKLQSVMCDDPDLYCLFESGWLGSGGGEDG